MAVLLVLLISVAWCVCLCQSGFSGGLGVQPPYPAASMLAMPVLVLSFICFFLLFFYLYLPLISKKSGLDATARHKILYLKVCHAAKLQRFDGVFFQKTHLCILKIFNGKGKGSFLFERLWCFEALREEV